MFSIRDGLSSTQKSRYLQQTALEDWGEQGQLELTGKHVVVVGAGGLGNLAASFLAGAGVGRLSIIDGDDVELSNLPRQIAYDLHSIGQAKVHELASRLSAQNDHIECTPYYESVDAENVFDLIVDCDLVLDCTDNFNARYLINRHCVSEQIALLSASVAKWQGQLMLIDPRTRQNGCYECLYTVSDQIGQSFSCRDLGVVGPMVGVLASLQATEALRYLIGATCTLSTQLLCIDGRDMRFQTFNRSRNLDCPVCSQDLVLKPSPTTRYEESSSES